MAGSVVAEVGDDSYMLSTLDVRDGATVLELGSGTGWATLLLAEAGYQPLGVDLAPANVEIGRRHARRWSSAAEFEVADLDTFDLGRSFDAVLMFDALHHVDDPAAVVARVGRHLKPGGWALFGEPSLLHLVSPGARAATRDRGWIENGISVHSLRRWCDAAGMPETMRSSAHQALPRPSASVRLGGGAPGERKRGLRTHLPRVARRDRH